MQSDLIWLVTEEMFGMVCVSEVSIYLSVWCTYQFRFIVRLNFMKGDLFVTEEVFWTVFVYCILLFVCLSVHGSFHPCTYLFVFQSLSKQMTSFIWNSILYMYPLWIFYPNIYPASFIWNSILYKTCILLESSTYLLQIVLLLNTIQCCPANLYSYLSQMCWQYPWLRCV